MIHELRCYTILPGKKDALLRRFHNGTFALFDRHGFKLVHFWDRPGSDELWYVLAWPGRDEMTGAWETFKNDNDWQSLKTSSEAAGPLIGSITSVVLNELQVTRQTA
jgi:hypothetical protein